MALSFALLWHGLAGSMVLRAGDVPSMTARPFRHPLILGQPRDPVLRLEVQCPSDMALTFESVRLNLSGTILPKDVAELTVFRSGPDGAFETAELVGRIVPSGPKVRVPLDLRIPKGRSILWIACTLGPDADLAGWLSIGNLDFETDGESIRPDFESGPAIYRPAIALRKVGADGVHTSRIPALTVSKTGTLLCVYDLRRRMGRDLQEDIDIGLSRSTDGGRTWEPVRVIMDMGPFGGLPEELNGCSDPGIVVDRETGEIFCFAVWMHGKPGKHQWVDDGSEPGFEIGKAAQLLMVRSSDEGRTWSKPENLTKRHKRPEWWLLAPAPQSGFQLSDGTLVMPVQGRTGRADKETFATIMTSTDHGQTWKVRTPAYSGGNECQAALLNDGRIMLNIRNDHERFRAVVVTSDLGDTWQPHPTSRNTLIEPNCNGSLIRIDWNETGSRRSALLFSNPHSQKSRTHQTIQVSLDDGATWPESLHLLLDEGRGAGYPSLTQIDDRHVGIVYEGSRAQVVFQKFRIVDLVDPGIARPGAKP